jgi:tetratricopeptide (TPR) repeat protein
MKGDMAKAIEDSTTAIDMNPELIDAYGVRGDSHFQAENFDQAIADYSKAIEFNPQLGEAYRKRAFTYYSNGQLAHAVADFESYIPLAPNNSARTEAQSYIDYLNDHGAKDGDVDFSPRMPRVDEDLLTEELLSITQDMAEIKSKRHLVIITPGRLIKTSAPLPGRETLEPKFLSMLEEIAPSRNQWNIIAIGMTEFCAFNASPHNSIPFLNLLHGFVQIGHAVILFEGHPSGFAQMCRNRDLLVVDSEMIPFLQSDWIETAKSTMRNPNILKVNRKGMKVLGTQRL